jgi:hypothetical protein
LKKNGVEGTSSSKNFFRFPPKKDKSTPPTIKPIIPKNMGLTWKILFKPYKIGKHKI